MRTVVVVGDARAPAPAGVAQLFLVRAPSPLAVLPCEEAVHSRLKPLAVFGRVVGADEERQRQDDPRPLHRDPVAAVPGTGHAQSASTQRDGAS